MVWVRSKNLLQDNLLAVSGPNPVTQSAQAARRRRILVACLHSQKNFGDETNEGKS